MPAPADQPDDDNVVEFTPKPSASVVMVDPDTARRWLGRNTKNRNLRAVVVDVYARDMAAGRWQLNGEAVKFAVDGSLLDGQHRLHAVIKSGATVPMFVVRGIQPNAQDVMDTGAKRSAADALSLHGKKHSSLLAATARNAITVQTVGYQTLGRHQVSTTEVQSFIEQHPDLEGAVNLARGWARDLDAPPAVIAYALWVLFRISPQQAVDFFQAAATRVGLQHGDPELAMGKRFAEARRNRERLSHAAYLSVIYRCWNYRRDDKPLRLVKVNSTAGGLIPVPEPK